MGAFVDHNFKKGFLLDEERLRKINEILLKRGNELGDAQPSYRVYRFDSSTYTTGEIQDVLSEDNPLWQRVTRLAVSLERDDDFLLKLDFDEPETALNIEGDDRDFVFAVFSDLRQYLSNEVNTRSAAPAGENVRVVMGVVTFVAIGALLGAMLLLSEAQSFQVLPAISAQTALDTQDIETKLNYLVQSERIRTEVLSGGGAPLTLAFRVMLGAITLMALAMFLRMIDEDSVTRLIERVFPRNLFLFGKEIERHAARQDLREKITWGIVFAFVVSIVAGLVVWLVTSCQVIP